jgi:hypothetical protein
MKVAILISDWDRISHAVMDIAEQNVRQRDAADAAIPDAVDAEFERVLESLSPWVKDFEFIVEFDTDAGTATVVPRK